jgi:hypothetical protein
MKKVILIAGVALALASAVAYAQMQYPRPGDTATAPQAQDQAHDRGHTMRPDRMPGQGHMMHRGHMPGQGRMAQQQPAPGHMMGPGHMMDHGRMQGAAQPSHATHGAQPKGDTGPSSLAFHAINKKMHDSMDIAFTGNADVDFVRGMIPHHQGAIDMAKTVIAFGKDTAVRKLAEDVIKAQEGEIALMQEWLKKNAP